MVEAAPYYRPSSLLAHPRAHHPLLYSLLPPLVARSRRPITPRFLPRWLWRRCPKVLPDTFTLNGVLEKLVRAREAAAAAELYSRFAELRVPPDEVVA